jgi:hypothetical protein
MLWRKKVTLNNPFVLFFNEHFFKLQRSGAAPIKFSLGGSKSNKGCGGGGGDKKRKSGAEEEPKTKFGFQKSHKIDPLDPMEGKNPAKNPGERMADSTASGPLFQQRPYPAPGSVLRGEKK